MCTSFCLFLSIAIVGGGIGGTSCAFALKQGLGANLSLALFEMGEVGGRLATIEMAGHEYESGGSIIHSQNREMATFVKTLGKSFLQSKRKNQERSLMTI